MRKLHLAICSDSNEILFVKLTDNKTPDHKVYPQYIEDAPKALSEHMSIVPMIERIAIKLIIIMDRLP